MRLHGARISGRSPVDLDEPPALHPRTADLDLGSISAQASELLSVLAMRARMSYDVR